MPLFHATWEIDVEADTPVDAARLALHYAAKPRTTATVFDIHREDHEPVRVDLDQIDEEDVDMQRAIAAGWERRYAGDPTEDIDIRAKGPVLYHAETDRVWTMNDPAGAWQDLGYSEDDFCRTCSVIYGDGGDGFDGECPNCADKSAGDDTSDYCATCAAPRNLNCAGCADEFKDA